MEVKVHRVQGSGSQIPEHQSPGAFLVGRCPAKSLLSCDALSGSRVFCIHALALQL